MDFNELVFRILDRRVTIKDYIDWADGLLVAGNVAPSIAELASCSWEPNPDADQVEFIFRSCVDELGLSIPSTWEEAFVAYIIDICNQVLHGEIEPQEYLSNMIRFAEDDDDSLLFSVWIDLANDISNVSGEIVFNNVLDLKNSSESIHQTASQFLSLFTMNLPARFPFIWHCKECGELSYDETHTDVLAKPCPACKSAFALRNMRFFSNRCEFLSHYTSCQAAAAGQEQTFNASIRNSDDRV